MQKLHFYNGIQTMTEYFGKNLTDRQQDYYFEDLKYASENDFDFAIKNLIRKIKPNPGNFPTIVDIQALCPQQKKASVYNNEETDAQYYRRITIDYLWTAYRILQNKGYDDFLKYCNDNNFNDSDIDSVECKHKMIFPEKFKLKMRDANEEKQTDNTERINELQQQAKEIVDDDIPF